MLCPVTIGHHIVNYRLLATYTIYIQSMQYYTADLSSAEWSMAVDRIPP